MTVKPLMLAVFFSIMLGVGFYSRRHATNANDSALGRRGVSPWLTAFAYGTSYSSAVVSIDYAGQFGWGCGLAFTWIGIDNALAGSLLIWAIPGRRTRAMSKHLLLAIMPEFFGSRFRSQGMKTAVSLIIFVFLIPYMASVYNGLSRLLGMALDVPYSVCVMGMVVLTAVYVTLGGYMATAINDFTQGIIILTGIIAATLSVLNGQGSFSAAVGRLARIPSEVPVTLGQPRVYISFFGPDPLNLLGVAILTSLGTRGLSQTIHKFYTIRSEKAVATGTVIFILFVVTISGGSYFLGGFGRLFDSSVIYNGNGSVAYDTTTPATLSSLSDLLTGVVVMLVLSISMSTPFSLVLTFSPTLTLDFTKSCLAKNMRDKIQLVLMQCPTMASIVLSVALALDPPDFIAQLVGIPWGALAEAFLAPFLYGLYRKKTTLAAVWASSATGIGIIVSNMFLHYIAFPISVGAVSMIVGLIIVPLVPLLTSRTDNRDTNAIFSCYDNLAEATTKKVLPDDQSFDSPVFKKRKKK